MDIDQKVQLLSKEYLVLLNKYSYKNSKKLYFVFAFWLELFFRAHVLKINIPKNCLNILKKNKECDSVVSVVKANEMHPIFMKSIKRNYLNSYLNKNVSFVRRQDIKPNVYRTNGAIYISRRDLILKNKNNLLYGNKVLPFIMPKDKSIDIDEELDFLICKAILNG